MKTINLIMLFLAVVGMGAFTAGYIRQVDVEIKALEGQILGLRDDLRDRDVQIVDVTAYTANRDECGKDPDNTAIMRRPVPGWTAAVSRDLLADGWTFGDRIWIEGVGLYEIADVMHPRFDRRIDVLVGTKQQAEEFGVREAKMAVRVGGGVEM